MTLTARQEEIVELALDALDELRGENQRAVEYAIDQIVNGASADLHGGARPERDAADAAVLIEAIKARLRAHGIDLPGTPPVGRVRRWEVE